ncbi:hypothetical protein [Pararobbsia alpina]|uniref:hypothetical protein n=1 Tax=Pararobbsia alpina TaxID=621374 RepID=UPI0039A4A3E2
MQARLFRLHRMSLTRLEDVSSSVAARHRFQQLHFEGQLWDFEHLEPLTLSVDLKLGFDVSIVAFFSCHCFTHGFRRDERDPEAIPEREIYDDGRERRVLDPDRYFVSKQYLRSIVRTLAERRIFVADRTRRNFVTLENIDHLGISSMYAVFFDVRRDQTRKRRLILQIQSAYVPCSTSHRPIKHAGKVGFGTLLRAAYTGRKIRG